MNDLHILSLILGLGTVTFICRSIFLVLIKNGKMPKTLNEVIDFIPVCVFSALVFPPLFQLVIFLCQRLISTSFYK